VAQERPTPKVAVEERLFSLVLALLATEIGLSKFDILSTVQGYRQSFVQGGNNDNLERKFERDKDDLRDLGIAVEAVDSPGDPGNNQTSRYRIPRSGYGFPADVRFTPEEVSLLGLAGMVWREGSLSGESRRALLKLRSLGATANEPVLGYAPRVNVRDAAFEPLNVALTKNAMVRFQYLKPGQSAARARTVEPLALVQHQGRWYLYGKEPDADRSKTFLLRRIVGAVVQTGTLLEAPSPGQSARALQELDDIWEAQVAVVTVITGSDADHRLGKRTGTKRTSAGSLSLHYSDLNLVADELASCGPEVMVVSPPELVTAVRERLQRTVTDHG
jgi:proteasome accessory factor B